MSTVATPGAWNPKPKVNEDQEFSADAPLTSTYTHVPRFEPGSAAASEYLEQKGFVVIKQVLSPKEAERAVELTWDYLEGLDTGIRRDDMSTWSDAQWPTTVHGAILSFHGIGQSAAQWYVRSRQRVTEGFAGIWGTDDLLTSFDGMSIFRPWKVEPSWKTNAGASWLHIDQHPITRPGLQCVQGLVNLLPMSRQTGGNVLIPHSHSSFADIPTNYPNRLAKVPGYVDHFRYPSGDPMLAADAEHQPIMCHLEVGDLLLWDSRTIHCSAPALDEPSTPQSAQLMRLVSLICMMPRAKASEEVLAERRQAPLRLNSTTNWSDRWINADEFPSVIVHRDLNKYPSTAGYKYKMVPAPYLTQRELKLVGFTQQEIDAGAYPHTCIEAKL